VALEKAVFGGWPNSRVAGVSTAHHNAGWQESLANVEPWRFVLGSMTTNILWRESLDQWYGPEHAFFKLRADDGNLYILPHQTSVPDGDWELVSFRRSKA